MTDQNPNPENVVETKPTNPEAAADPLDRDLAEKHVAAAALAGHEADPADHDTDKEDTVVRRPLFVEQARPREEKPSRP